jgi:peroxiredoxin
MEDIEFSVYKNPILKKITAKDLFSNRRILVCSVTRPMDHISLCYINNLYELLPFYKQNGIDDIVLINSSRKLFLLAKYDSHDELSRLPFLSDSTLGFVSYFQKLCNKNQPTEFLAKFWNYQALFNNGVLEHFGESSTTNPIKESMIADPWRVKNYGQRYLNEKPELALWCDNLFFTDQINKKILKLMYYNHIWPNTKLDQYLIDNNKNT